MNNEQITLQPNFKPSKGKWFALSFQHVFAMFAATVLVPLLTNMPVSAALFASGVGTLIYIMCTRAKVPMYLGSSFAYIAYISYFTVSNEPGFIPNYGAALTGIVVIGLVYVLVAVVIKFAGVKWLKQLLPPVVVGPMIMVIGLGLAYNAVGANNAQFVKGGDWRAMVVAIGAVLIVAFTALKSKGFFKVIPFLVGIIGGYVLALIMNLIPGPLNADGSHAELFNFEPLKNLFVKPEGATGSYWQECVSQWFRLPELKFIGWKDADLGAGLSMYKVSFAGVLSILPLAFVTICEHIGDHEVMGRITKKDYLEDPGLHRTLIGDGIATAVAGMIGGPANTSYGENTSVVGITKVGSVWVIGGAAVIAIILSFFNVFSVFIQTIPGSVIGGISIVLYGFIAANGLKTIIDSKVDLNITRNLIIISVMLVIGVGGAVIAIGEIFQFSSMALSAIIGVLLNLILPGRSKNVTNNNADE